MADTDLLLGNIPSPTEAIDTNICPPRRSGSRISRLVQQQSEESFKPAEPWACRPCGLLLGISHLLIGITLIVYDVATNSISETAFAITSGICFLVSGILSLIASRRLDRGTIFLFLIFSLTSLCLSTTMFVESVAVSEFSMEWNPNVELSSACGCALSAQPHALDSSTFGFYSISKTRPDTRCFTNCSSNLCVIPELCSLALERMCESKKSVVHGVLVCYSLIEGFICCVSIIVGVRSLRNLHRGYIQDPCTPFAALAIRDLVPPGNAVMSQSVAERRILQQEISTGKDSKVMLEYLVED